MVSKVTEQCYVDCVCNDFNHVVRLSLDLTNGDVFIESRLNHCLPWYKRIVCATKYVLGFSTNKHYMFSYLNKEQHDDIRDLLLRSKLASTAANARKLLND